MKKVMVIMVLMAAVVARGQAPSSEMEKLRQQYTDTTKEYKASLERLLALYKASVKKAEERREKADALFKDGQISKTELEQAELALTAEQLKVTSVEQQITEADAEIANALIEIEGEKQLAKLTPQTFKRAIARHPKNSDVRR